MIKGLKIKKDEYLPNEMMDLNISETYAGMLIAK